MFIVSALVTCGPTTECLAFYDKIIDPEFESKSNTLAYISIAKLNIGQRLNTN